MRVGSLRLVLRVVFLALAASLFAVRRRAAASVPDYRCCFRIDALMTGQIDIYDNLPGKPSDDERASFTFMTSELLVYSFTGSRPHLRRAFTRRRGTWPQTDGPGVAFGVGRVTTHDASRGACDVEDSSRLHERAEPDEPHVQGRARTPPQSRGRAGSRRHRRESGPGLRRDPTRREDGPLDGLSAGGPTSHLVPPTRAQWATLKTKKLSRVRRFGKDVKHNPILSTLIPHKTTGFVRVELHQVRRSATGSSPRRRRSGLSSARPTRVSSLRCS